MPKYLETLRRNLGEALGVTYSNRHFHRVQVTGVLERKSLDPVP